MKTYPVLSDKGDFLGFEIDNTLIRVSTIVKLLQKNLKIQNIQKQKFFDSSEVRINFIYKNKDYIVWEPFGDNSRYWIGLVDGEKLENNLEDLKDIEKVFKKHKLFYFL
jgi:hypothetical protein